MTERERETLKRKGEALENKHRHAKFLVFGFTVNLP